MSWTSRPNRVVGVRCPAPNVIVAQIELVLEVPTGPLCGTNTMLATAVIVDTSDGWQVAAVQETLVVPHDPPPAE